MEITKKLKNNNHACKNIEFTEMALLKRAYILNRLGKIPQFEQKSQAWFNQRNNCLTATAIAAVLDEDPYKFPSQLLLDKCGRGEPFIDNANVHHGKKYEKIGSMHYSEKNNIHMLDFGLLQHEVYSFIGASPDGICSETTLTNDACSTLVGRLLEIKFPKLRKIVTEGELDGEICPHYYYIQVQTQLFVTGLDECDFLQCQMEEYSSRQEFLNDLSLDMPGISKTTNLSNGCIIQLFPKKLINKTKNSECLYNSIYIYPPKLCMTLKEIDEWLFQEFINFQEHELAKDHVIDKVIYWRFTKIACNLIKADNEWFLSKLPMLKQFWDYILFYRENKEKLNQIEEYITEIGIRKSKLIFERINEDYLSVNKDSYYKPLYQNPSNWRMKYNKKYKK